MKEEIRFASLEDCDDILEIYRKYVLETAVSFEIVVPTREEFQERMAKIMAEYPYLVYQVDGKVTGYAYATKHAERAAYRFDVDLSIYFSDKFQKKGKATLLYTTLLELLEQQGYFNAYVAYTSENKASEVFHEKLGFTTIGTFSHAGYKLGKWHHLTWAEKTIQDYSSQPKEPTSITKIASSHLEAFFIDRNRKYFS